MLILKITFPSVRVVEELSVRTSCMKRLWEDNCTMGTITVEFFFPIRKVTMEKRHEFSFKRECLMLGDLVKMIIERFGPLLEEALFDPKKNQLKPIDYGRSKWEECLFA